MTTFAEMRTLVTGLTKRPELVAVTDLAIKTATLRAHQVDFFPQDADTFLVTYVAPVNNEVFTEITGLQLAAPLLRTLDWMQGEDPSTGIPVENLEYVDSYKEFWDEEKMLKTSVFTRLGDTLRARFTSPSTRARVYYYKNPNVSTVSYNSWVADMHPEELAMWAAGIVWARSGNMEQAKTAFETGVTPFKELLVISHLTGKH